MSRRVLPRQHPAGLTLAAIPASKILCIYADYQSASRFWLLVGTYGVFFVLFLRFYADFIKKCNFFEFFSSIGRHVSYPLL